MSNLILDIGNTRIKIAVFENKEMLFSQRVENFDRITLRQLSNDYALTSVILSNTGILENGLLEDLKDFFPMVLYLDHNTPLPIVNLYGTPYTLGKDRLAAAVGAQLIFPQSNCLIIDMGTCITLDYLTNVGQFLGGNITPGIQMRLRAMHEFTAKLPMVEIAIPDILFGNSTITAMQNGAVKGAFLEIETFIEEVKTKYGSINVILTGGDAHFFERYTKNEIFVAPNLVLEGLNEILQYNAD